MSLVCCVSAPGPYTVCCLLQSLEIYRSIVCVLCLCAPVLYTVRLFAAESGYGIDLYSVCLFGYTCNHIIPRPHSLPNKYQLHAHHIPSHTTPISILYTGMQRFLRERFYTFQVFTGPQFHNLTLKCCFLTF